VYVLNGPEKTSFIATENANFSYLDNVPTYGNNLLFESEAIATYPPLIRRYNLKKRGEQFVNVLIPTSTFLPPVRQTISITSIGKDVIEIEGRQISCDRLVLELKRGDLISVWITKRLHNVLMVDMPRHGFKAVFCTEKKDIPTEKYTRKSDLYVEKEVAFTNEEIVLYGTLLIPTRGKAPYPSLMLICDSGPINRDNFGIFTDIAHTLGEAGYCVLRFDKRGIGKSQGFFAAYDQSGEISDLKCAIDFLKSLPEVDKSRIALLGHSEGGFYATYLAGSDEDVKTCIIMSALSSLSPLENDCSKLKKLITNIAPDDYEYLESAITAIKQSREIIKDKSDWVTVLNKRVFTKKMNLENKYNAIDTMKKVKIPVLILHGRKDTINFVEEARELGDALAEAGNDNFTIIYFGGLDYFFGTMVKEHLIEEHIEVDMEVLKSITTWLDKNLPQQPAESIIITENISAGESQKPLLNEEHKETAYGVATEEKKE
jgi:hypothetical protein